LLAPINPSHVAVITHAQKSIVVQLTSSHANKEPVNESATQPAAAPKQPSEKQSASEPTIQPAQPQPKRHFKGRLDLSLPNDNSPWLKSRIWPQGGLTANGAVVMDGELLKALNENKAPAPISNTDTSFILNAAGSGQTHFMKIGEKCFRVVEADPLDSGSVESWWPVRCR